MQPVSCRGTAEEVKAMIKTDRRDDLPYPYRFPIDSLLLHRLQGQLPARLPGIGPPGVGDDVADGVVDHGIGGAVDDSGGQLVLPVGVPILVIFRIVGRAQGAGGIAVALFVLDITAAVILISPALVIGLIVHPDKLPYWVIDIADGLPLVDNGGDIAVIIVGIAQVVPALRDAADQRRGAVCPIASCRVA